MYSKAQQDKLACDVKPKAKKIKPQKRKFKPVEHIIPEVLSKDVFMQWVSTLKEPEKVHKELLYQYLVSVMDSNDLNSLKSIMIMLSDTAPGVNPDWQNAIKQVLNCVNKRMLYEYGASFCGIEY